LNCQEKNGYGMAKDGSGAGAVSLSRLVAEWSEGLPIEQPCNQKNVEYHTNNLYL